MASGVVARAQDATSVDPDQKKQELKALQGDIREAEKRRKALEADAAKIAAERADLQRRAVEAAARTQAAEDAVSAAALRLAELSQTTEERARDLDARRGDLDRSLAALQRLARQPPAAMLLRPGEPVDVIRGGLLLGTAVPALAAEARRLVAELGELNRLRSETEQERVRLVAARDDLVNARKELAALIARRAAAEATTRANLASERKRLADLAADAKDLKALIAAAEEAKRARERAEREAAERAAAEAARAAAAEEASKRAEAARLKAAILVPPRDTRPPASSRESVLPVRGLVVTGFGQADGEGLKSRGVHIRAAATAQVVSPVAGQIVFAGPFKGYGQLLIVAAGEGYHLLLAGLGRIDGAVGQRVVAGEPVGRMGDGSAEGGPSGGSGGPELYVELRRDGEPVDPLPWIGAGGRKTPTGRTG
jgi:septal ring factor EnvC (AmiA/AmiB activator)